MLNTEASNSEPLPVSISEECCYKNKLDIALLKKDVDTIRDTFQQSESSICRLEQVAIDISKNASLHEQKINSQDKLISEIERVLETQKQDNNEEIQKLNNKVNTVNIELSNKINQTERTILSEIHELKEDLSKKISDINMYRYMIVGAIALGAFIISKSLDIFKIFH